MSEVPLQPVGREQIHRLESALLVASLFSEEVIEQLRNPEERVTWVDSLAVAAGALAREKAGMSVPEIAEDLGRTEATIRNHLKGRTEAGRIVLKIYEKFVREGVKVELPGVERVRRELEEERRAREELEKKLSEVRKTLKELLEKLG